MVAHEELVALLCGEGLQHGEVRDPARIEKSRAEGTDDDTIPQNMLLMKEGRARGGYDLSPRGGKREGQAVCWVFSLMP